MLDLEVIGDGLADLVLDAVQRATAPLIARIDILEKRPTHDEVEARVAEAVRSALLDLPAPKEPDIGGMIAEAIAALPVPKDGKDADPEAVREIIRAEVEAAAPRPEEIERKISEHVEAAVAALPRAKDGEDPDPEHIAALIADAVSAIPLPQDGKSVTAEDLAPLIVEEVQKAAALIPTPKDGVGLAGAIIDRDGHLILTMTDGATKDMGPVVGRDGVDAKGEPGRDGFRLEDFDSEVLDGGRTLVLSFTAGDTKHTVEHQLDTMIYRGAYKADHEYQPGDTVTCGGQTFHCNAPTTDRPDGGSETWTLCSRRGRDGKDADPAPMLRLIEDKFAQAEDSLMKRIEAFLRSKGL